MFEPLPKSFTPPSSVRDRTAKRVVILNPKGGSGKTTIATNLASCLAAIGRSATLLDLDRQGSATRWLGKRPDERPSIHGIAGFERNASVTRTWQMRVPPECEALVVDTPAAIDSRDMPEITRGAAAVLVPVMPSDIDIHATAKCIADLLLVAKIRRSEGRLGIIANRVRSNTRISYSLARFLESLDIPLIATLRDSQSYIRAAETGLGLFEMPRWQVSREIEEWEKLLAWFDERPAVMPRSSAVTSLAAKR